MKLIGPCSKLAPHVKTPASNAILACAAVWMAGCAHTDSTHRIEYLADTRNPAAPFSTAVRVGEYLYVSGQIGVRPPDAGSSADGVQAAARRAMAGVQRALQAGGATFDDVFKCTIMLSDMNDWDTFNHVYVTYFKPGRLPARSAIGANGLAMNAAFEVECVAYKPRAWR